MPVYKFRIKEVNRSGYIAWDAIDEDTGDNFAVNQDGYLVAGDFPEITEYLKKNKKIDFEVSYDDDEDSLMEQVWTYTRGQNVVIVQDIPRTILRIEPMEND